MEKTYRKIEFGFGDINSAMEELKSHKDLVCGSFNGQMIYYDIDDIDSAYQKITGRTKAEFDAEREKEHLEYEAEKKRRSHTRTYKRKDRKR